MNDYCMCTTMYLAHGGTGSTEVTETFAFCFHGVPGLEHWNVTIITVEMYLCVLDEREWVKI